MLSLALYLGYADQTTGSGCTKSAVYELAGEPSQTAHWPPNCFGRAGKD
jgi:hypothetical protein